MASATASPAAAATAIAATVTAAIVAAVAAAAKILSGTVVAAASRIVLRGIVMGREILGRGRVGIRLALLWRFGVVFFQGSGLSRISMFLEVLAFCGRLFLVGSVRLIH